MGANQLAMKKTLLSAILSMPLLLIAQSPITTSGTQYTPQQLVTDVLLEGTDIQVTNVTSSTGTNYGTVNGLGYFTSGNANFPFVNGVILSTGNIEQAPGPNNTQNGGTLEWLGDNDVLAILQQLSPQAFISLNATKLEFDFIAPSDHIDISYIFASDEYGDFQCSFSDAFVIMLTDLDTGVTSNLAIVPGTTIPVTVNSVRNNQYNSNCNSQNAQYFGAYYSPTNINAPINFNGRTMPLTAGSTLNPGHNYHLKIAIAERNDQLYDSALFVGEIAFSMPIAIGTPNDLYGCDFNLDGVATFNLLENNAAVLDGQDPAGLTITYFETLSDAENNAVNNAIASPGDYTNIMAGTLNSQTIYARLSSNTTEAYDVASFQIIAAPQPYAGDPAPVIVLDDDTDGLALVNLTTQEAVILDGLSPASFEITYYTSAGNADAGSPSVTVPYNYFTSSSTVYFRLENSESGCYDTGEIEVIVLPSDYETPAPDGSEEQQFEDGDTLADIEVEGEDIQWYDNAGQAGPPNTNDTETPLPLNTLLVDGETYYASQTIYGIESVQRRAVTVHTTMEAGESIFKGFISFPNPVKDVLNISNKNNIDKVEMYNLVSQLVLSRTVNTDSAVISLQSLAKGVYILKVLSGKAEKVVRIVKE